MAILRFFRRYYQPIHGNLVIGTGLTLVVLLFLQGKPFFTRAELAAYDYHFYVRPAGHVNNNIVFVAVDQTSIDDLGQLSTRVPRAWTARAVDYLHRAGAKVIGLDFLYLGQTSDDAALATAIKRAGNVVVTEALSTPDATAGYSAETQLEAPVDTVGTRARALGVANVSTDYDGTIRALDLQQPGPGGTYDRQAVYHPKLYPAFAAEMAGVALHQPVSRVIAGLPQTMYINYVGQQLAGQAGSIAFPTYQFEGVARGEDNPAAFRNKLVIVGCAAITCQDTKKTPYGDMYGAVVQANILRTILNRDTIVPVGNQANSLIVLVIGLLTTIAASRFGIYRSMAATLVLAVGYAFLAYIFVQSLRVWMYVITPEATLVIVFGGIMALRFATEERRRRRTRKIFGQYVKPEIVDILVNTPDEETALAGARRPISVLFVDVRGFTAMSEQMEPEQVLAALDVYLEELTQSVTRFDGLLDKYVGDEIMALWNAPRFQENHALLAVQSALDMVGRMDRINEQLRAKGLPSIGYGIGVNTGEAVVGQMGSSIRKQYDVIGDAINTGARLCSAAGRGEIIIGEQTWELIGAHLEVEETEPLRLKGKSQPFRTFLVVGLKAEAPSLPVPAAAPA